MTTTDFPESVVLKLNILKGKLGTEDLESALDKSLDLANFVVDTVNSPESKLLIERDGRFTELKGIA